jgi:hypothetical protein
VTSTLTVNAKPPESGQGTRCLGARSTHSPARPVAAGYGPSARAGPFDEAVVLIALGLIAVFWRPVLRDIRAATLANAAADQ